MKMKYLCFAMALAIAGTCDIHAQGTAFTYQGRLNDGGNSANGNYDLTFALFETPSGSSQQGNTLTNAAAAVSNGLFTVTLDFGNQFSGADRWLEVGVRTNGGGAFATLSPRQPITSTPYAVQAANAALATGVSGSVATTQLTGNISSNNIAAGSITGTMLATASVSSANLANGAVSLEKLSVLYRGKLLTTFSNAAAGNAQFGQSVAYEPFSDSIAIGAPFAIAPWGIGDPNAPTSAVNGLVFIFNTSGAVLNTLFDFSTLNYLEEFGYSVASRNGSYLVGSPNYSSYGRAYFKSAANGDAAVFVNPNPGGLDRFGETVAGWFSLNLSAIGAPRKNIGAGFAGAVYLFNNLSGTLTATLTNPAPTGNAHFGAALLSVGSAGLLVGAPGGGAASQGAAYYYSNVASPTVTTVFTNPTPASQDNFGQSLATIGTTRVLIGAPYDDTGATNAGAVYLFSTTGTLLTTFTNPAPVTDGLFGKSMAVVGTDKILISSPGNGNGGVVYLFNTNGTILGIYANPKPQNGIGFGTAIATVGTDRTVVGCPAANVAYLFHLFENPYVPGLIVDRLTEGSITSTSIADGAVTAEKISGILNDFQLSTNIAKLSAANQVFTGPNTYVGTFIGSGASLTALDASQLSDGTISDARLSANVALLTAGKLSDSALSTNVALRSENNTFHGDQFVNGALNVNSPGYPGVPAIIRARSGDNIPFAVQDVNGNNLLLVFTNSNGQVNIAGPAYAQSFNPTSDRHAKENFVPVSPLTVLDKVLSLPISQWNFKTDPLTPHLGPMAQDFYSAFRLGPDDRHIATVDADGVALAAIQGLNQKLAEELKRRDAENTNLKARLERLENLLTNKVGGGAK